MTGGCSVAGVRNPAKGLPDRSGIIEDRERHLLIHGPTEKPKEVPTLKEFAPTFVEQHAKANRQKPSGIAAKETILNQHLLPAFGDRRLDQITSEHIQRLKLQLDKRSAKTVNNVLTVLNTLLKKAVEWGVIERVPCAIKLLPTQRPEIEFYDFDQFSHLLSTVEQGSLAEVVVLLGGHAGLRCGEIMALRWSDVDLRSGIITVAQSEWKGHVTLPKGGKPRRVTMTETLRSSLQRWRHLRGPKVVCGPDGSGLTQKMVQGVMRRAAVAADLKPGVHILRHTFCSHLAMHGMPVRSIQELAGHQDLKTTLLANVSRWNRLDGGGGGS